MSQVVVTLDRTANTSAATVPTALDEAGARWPHSTRSIGSTRSFLAVVGLEGSALVRF